MQSRVAFKNILVVRSSGCLGDVVLTTPAIKALREACPKARISILISPLTCDIIAGNPYLDEILVDDHYGIHCGMVGFLKLVSFIQQKYFDLAIVYFSQERTNLLCFLAGIPRRVGYKYKNLKFGFLLTDPLPDKRHLGLKYDTQYFLDILRHLDITDSIILDKSPEALAEDLYVAMSAQDTLWANRFYRDNNILDKEILIAIHPGAGDSAKQWPTERFAELINRLAERYQGKIVLIGALQTTATARQIISRINIPVLDLTGKTTLGQMAAIIKRCQLLVSNDSGPVHVAVAVGTLVVSIFPRYQPGIDSKRWYPLGKAFKVVHPSSPQPIPPRMVLEAVDLMFKTYRSGYAS